MASAKGGEPHEGGKHGRLQADKDTAGQSRPRSGGRNDTVIKWRDGGGARAGRTQFAPTEAGIYADITIQAGGFWTELRSSLRWWGFMRTLRFKPTNFGQNCVRPYGGGDLCGHYGSSRRILARTASDRVLTLSKSVAWM